MIMRERADSSSDPISYTERGGIKEEIPDKFRDKYEAWKNEFLSTETGRRQWETYAHNKGFTLTINISSDNRRGATTGRYKWNDAGELVGATITLGSQIDEGYPDPVYYPVMNSLSWSGGSDLSSGRLLAATKIAHEFGHVNRALSVDGSIYRLQNQLMPVYKRIFLSNGHDARDPRLLKLARQMGGTSVEIWEDREYWGEVNAMLYLRDRIPERNSRCMLFSRIRRTVEAYAEPYEERFKQIARLEPALCSWQ
jgi:YD repeat-containing protein